jgi:hypothetical protein
MELVLNYQKVNTFKPQGTRSSPTLCDFYQSMGCPTIRLVQTSKYDVSAQTSKYDVLCVDV